MKILVSGLLCLSLLMLTACSTSQLVQIETVYIRPPAALLRTILPPTPAITTNLDLLNFALELSYIVEQLNADKEALNAYYSAMEKQTDE